MTADATRAEPVLAPAARTWRGWLDAVRRDPWPVVALVAGVVVVNATLSQFDESGVVRLLRTGSWIVLGPLSTSVVGRLLGRSAPAAGVPSVERLRPPVDVRRAAPVPPVWRWSGLLGRSLAAASVLLAALLAVCAATLVAALRDGSGAALFVAVLLAFGVVLAAGGLVVTLALTPTACRHVVRHGAPSAVEVLGVEHRSQKWHVRPVDGGDVIVLAAFRGRSRLVAGDVVHLWLAAERPDPYERRAAVTGPFGTLWPTLPDQDADAAAVRD